MLLAYLPFYFILFPSLLFLSTLSYPHFNPVRMDISFLRGPRDNQPLLTDSWQKFAARHVYQTAAAGQGFQDHAAFVV